MGEEGLQVVACEGSVLSGRAVASHVGAEEG